MPRAPQRAPGWVPARPIGDVLRQPRLIAAVACGMASYAVMSLVMTPTSLAMNDHGFTASQAADVVRWHVFAMYAPSFFTGALIRRVGHFRIIGTGLVLLAGCAAIALMGVELHHFYLALIVLGIGWNFGFIGATSLLATVHSTDEQVLIRGLNDFLVFGLVALASFGSGALLTGWGWNAVQYAAIPAVIVALGVLAWCGTGSRQRHPDPIPEN
jgi:MFS family permease